MLVETREALFSVMRDVLMSSLHMASFVTSLCVVILRNSVTVDSCVQDQLYARGCCVGIKAKHLYCLQSFLFSETRPEQK